MQYLHNELHHQSHSPSHHHHTTSQLQVIIGKEETREGSEEDALKILAILHDDHRSVDGDDQPLNLNEALLGNNPACKELLTNWLAAGATDQINKTMEEYKGVVMCCSLHITNWLIAH
jgi:hypothetical protein